MMRLSLIAVLILSSLFFMGGDCGGVESGDEADCSKFHNSSNCGANTACEWALVEPVCSMLNAEVLPDCSSFVDSETCLDNGCIHWTGFFSSGCQLPAQCTIGDICHAELPESTMFYTYIIKKDDEGKLCTITPAFEKCIQKT